MSRLQAAAILGSLAASVSAHGVVQGIVAGGKWYQGYSPSFQYADPPPTVIGWSIPEDSDLGFVAPSAFSDPDIICHKGATPGGASAKVEAGSQVELQWTDWPESHHGPVIDYLAKCSGSCTNADKTSLEFFKIDQGGLVDGSSPPGTWASDQLIANNQSWVVTIPKSIAPGNYVLRHEIIALHSAGNEDGAQNYPQCINLEITGSGSDSPSGVLGTALYKADDPGILINIYTPLSSYKIPGPALIAGAESSEQTTIPSDGAASVSAAPIASATSVPAQASGSADPSSVSYPSPSYGPSSSSYAAPSYAAPGPSSSLAAPASGSASDSASGSASASVSYPVSSAAPASSSGDCTTTITLSGSAKPSSSVAAPVSSSAVFASSSSSSSSYPAAPLPSSGGPASYFAPAASSVVSSAAASSSAPSSSTAAAPSEAPAPPPKYPADEPIPQGFTFGDLLAWLKYTVRNVFNKGSKKHARDFRTR